VLSGPQDKPGDEMVGKRIVSGDNPQSGRRGHLRQPVPELYKGDLLYYQLKCCSGHIDISPTPTRHGRVVSTSYYILKESK